MDDEENEEKLKKPEYELVKVYLQGQGVYHIHFQSLTVLL